MEEISPLVTTWEGSRCTRISCSNVIRQGDPYRLIRPQDGQGNAMGVQVVCVPCYDHYINKAGTKRRGVPAQPLAGHPLQHPSTLSPEAVEGIRKQTASAQRNSYVGGKSPIQAVGLQIQNPYAGPAFYPTTAHSPVYPVAAVAPQPTGHFPTSASVPEPVDGFRQLGYNANHHSYLQQRELVKMVAAGVRQEFVRVNASVQYLVEGKSKPKQLGNICERLKQVPADLLPAQLKQWIFDELKGRMGRDTHNYPFQTTDFELCGAGLSDLEKHPSAPAIYDQCFRQQVKQGRIVRTFIPNHMVDVFLVVKKEVWPCVMAHMEEHALAAESEAHGPALVTAHVPAWHSIADAGPARPVKVEPSGIPRSSELPQAGGQKRRGTLSTPSTPRANKRMSSCPVESTQETAVGRALQASDLQKITTATVTISHGLFLPIPVKRWDDLVTAMERLTINYESDGCVSVLRLDEYHKNMLGRPGTFKTAHPAYLTLTELPVVWEDLPIQPFRVTRPTPVAGKRYFIRDSPSGPRIPADIKTESAFLEQEANLLYWATSLHNLSNDFVDQFLEENPGSDAASLHIPKTRMVYGGLFQHTGHGRRQGLVTLIEELVSGPELEQDVTGKGKNFVKFISNASPAPRITTGPAGVVGRFLSFSQHVQYLKTDGLAFVSDYQGSLTMLSDPQLITNPKLGPIFGEGNVTSAYYDFELLHNCNEYCQAFGLAPLHASPTGTEEEPLFLKESEPESPTSEEPPREPTPATGFGLTGRQPLEQVTATPSGEKNVHHPGSASRTVLGDAGVPAKGPVAAIRSSSRIREKSAASKGRGYTQTHAHAP